MATAGTSCVFMSKLTILSGRYLLNWLLNFAKWRLADGGFWVCLVFFFKPATCTRGKETETTECRDFCRCVEGEHIHTYAQKDRCSYACIHIKHFEHLLLTWACRVLGRYSVRQEWRGWLRVCFRILSVYASTLSVWAHAVPLDLQWGHPCLYSQGSGSQSLKSGQLLVAALVSLL